MLRWLVRVCRHGPPRLAVSVLRASVALVLTHILIFLGSFDRLSSYPVALSATILVVVCAAPGRSVGGCVEASLLGGAGVAAGVVTFVILGQLGSSPVGQGICFAVAVYLGALLRAQGPRWVSFYLFSILLGFQGIYTTLVNEGRFSKEALLGYFQAYGWGIAIALVVNLLVWPVSAERECRDLLVTSLQHVSTLAHLTCKTYAKEITKDEEEVRDLLVETIRGDFGALTARLEEASFEILYTRWSMKDYSTIIQRVRGLQQALITSSSALELIDNLDPEGINVRRHILAKSEAAATFGDFRHGIDIVIAEIIDELLGRDALLPEQYTMQTLEPNAEAHIDMPALRRVGTIGSSREIATIGARLRREVQLSEDRHQHIRHGSYTDGRPSRIPEEGHSSGPPSRPSSRPSSRPTSPHRPSRPTSSRRPSHSSPNPSPSSDGVSYFRRAWDRFAKVQTEGIFRLIKDGALQVEDVLRIEAGMPSLQAMYSERLPKAWTSSLISSTPLQRLRSRDTTASSTSLALEADTLNSPVEDAPCSEAMVKSYSLLFGLGQLSDELCALHGVVKAKRPKRLRFHIFERSFRWRSPEDPMSLQEALAALRGTAYTAPPIPLISRLSRAEQWFRKDASAYAAKVAMGASVYTVLLLAPGPRSFFINYGMTSSLITVIVAISPTLGQSFRTFLLQLTGTGLGSLYGLVILEIFKNVGGYHYNPYGLTAALALWAGFASWVFYVDAKYYTAGLLLMTGASNIVILEWIYSTVPILGEGIAGPPLRAAYAIAVMCISILIAAAFQLLVFRTPARRQLRLNMAAVTFGLSSYNTLLQSNINAVAPADDAPAPPPEALATIQRELIKRETKLQSQIIALRPVWEFARAEPNLSLPFRGPLLLKIIRSHQIILDRLREARTAVGSEGFNQTIHHDFASKLFPYRLHSQRLTRTLFYLSATSLVSKTPLPRDVPSSRPTWASFENDALVLSRRLSQMPQGEEELRRPGFLRYWFYLVSLGSVSAELEELEHHLGELFGVPEMTNPNIT